MVARSAQSFRIAKKREEERAADAPSKTRARFRRKPSAVPRLFRPADTFGATFCHQKVVNPLLAGNLPNIGSGLFPKN